MYVFSNNKFNCNSETEKYWKLPIENSDFKFTFLHYF
jgi:hypothetical protein